MDRIDGKKIAILATDGFERSELYEPMEAIKKAGGEVEIVSLEGGQITAWNNGNWSDKLTVDKTVDEVSDAEYDGLVLPGGVINPDRLRMNKKAVEFVKSFFGERSQRPVAAICHGPWMLAEAGVANGRRMTSYASIKTDLENAGADWVDEEVVVDKGLVTSRSPKDLDAFCSKIVEEFKEGRHMKAG